MTDEKLARPVRVSRTEAPDLTVAIGEWYWLTVEAKYRGPDRVLHDGTKQELVCVTHVGSNYVRVDNVGDSNWRVHFDEFDARLTPEPHAQRVVQEKVDERRLRVRELMGEVQALTAQLALGAGTGHTQAISLRVGEPIEGYKRALIKAKEKTLPALFEQIKEQNEGMAMWMKAPLLPLRAQAHALKPVIKAIEGRIFNVELYAGLVEQVVQVADGEPAPTETPIHMLQRRAYMDEECLIDYTVGGMEFADVEAFDAWMAAPAQTARLLPFPRCVLAMQVRRGSKDRDLHNPLRGYIDFSREEKWDESTFLYLRNGAQLFRLKTGIEFGARLFPDVEQAKLLDGSVLYAKCFSGISAGKDAELITEGHYREMRETYITRDRYDKHPRPKKEAAALRKEIERKERAFQQVHLDFYSWVRWDRRSTYYDDVAKVVEAQVEQHNRLVMVLQGLLDRSPVFAPHPAWRLWEQDGFAAALRLVHDDSRALVAGAAPDFEAFRARLNATLTTDCVTIGQEDFWEETEAKRENARYHGWRGKPTTYARYRPYGNHGPGKFARPARLGQQRAFYQWNRERQRHRRWGNEGPLGCRLWVPFDRLLNVTAYQPGDYRQFFADPRTRAEYLQWAPLLLEAEEHHAGNRRRETR